MKGAMKRALIITSAGCSRRFSDSLGKDILKVLYSDGEPKECLLGHQLELTKHEEINLIVIVGGYKYAELRSFIKENYDDPRIELVYNDKFREYGSCYSFACGLNSLSGRDIDEVILMEGDLVFDARTFKSVIAAGQDVITANPDIVRSDTAVVFYVTIDGVLHYAYDTQHKALHIKDAFTMFGNSGQIWKFRDVNLLFNTVKKLGEGLYDDTNLLPIEHYFNARGMENVMFIKFEFWVNCNTIKDYQVICKYKGRSYE